MKILLLLFLCLSFSYAVTPPAPESVLVLFNNTIPESKKLADDYSLNRSIPEENLIGLSLPDTEIITRQQYKELIEIPLKKLFDTRKLWQRGKAQDGTILAGVNKIRVIAVMKGVPLKISQDDSYKSQKAIPNNLTEQQKFLFTNSAAVDSELAFLSVENYDLTGPSNNQYFKSSKPITEANVPYLMLVGRIDAHSYEVCHRMIKDAVAIEKSGLWGRAYFDLSNKYPDGDLWIRGAAVRTAAQGIPCIINPWNDSYTQNYPMNEAAIYYGWYEWNVNGPFLNHLFQFKPGAVAVHLHSFSADTLRDLNKNWSAPLLARGAAATIGNVYEPLLGFTHQFQIMQQRLLEGFTLVEAAYSAIPVVSWQGIVLGDPLYRPFLHLDGSGEILPHDKVYRALRVASILHGNDSGARLKKLDEIATKKNNSVFYETIGLEYLDKKNYDVAWSYFEKARAFYPLKSDQLRMDLYQIDMLREQNKKPQAVEKLKLLELTYKDIPEVTSIRALITILNPPPPPPAPATPPAKK